MKIEVDFGAVKTIAVHRRYSSISPGVSQKFITITITTFTFLCKPTEVAQQYSIFMPADTSFLAMNGSVMCCTCTGNRPGEGSPISINFSAGVTPNPTFRINVDGGGGSGCGGPLCTRSIYVRRSAQEGAEKQLCLNFM